MEYQVNIPLYVEASSEGEAMNATLEMIGAVAKLRNSLPGRPYFGEFDDGDITEEESDDEDYDEE